MNSSLTHRFVEAAQHEKTGESPAAANAPETVAPLASQDKSTSDELPMAFTLLIDDRLAMPHLTGCGVQY